MSTGHSTTPVRLISVNGRFYELNCTSVSIDVDRKVMAVPLPFASSSRVTADLNLTTSVITLEGVITDGDTVLSSTGTNAKSFIDFSARTVAIDANYNPSEGFSGNKISLYSNAHGFYTVSDALNDNSYADAHSLIIWDGTFTSGNPDTFIIFFGVNSAAAGYATTAVPNEYILAFHDGTSYKTEAELATGLYNLITNEIATINATIVTGVNGGNTKVEMTYTNPPTGNLSHSRYTDNTYPRVLDWASLKSQPLISTFSGGVPATSSQNLSAGDTVQQLYAILSNSNAGVSNTGHYIVGLQLPYLSSVRAVSADEKYKSVVMYTTAGIEDLPHKDKNFNYAQFSGSAGDIFDGAQDGDSVGMSFKGMRAVVDKATFVQVGGEPNVYSFTILMLVTNMIL